MLVLAAAFGVYALSTRQAKLWVFLVFPMTYVWFMTMQPAQFPRWVLPTSPLLR